MGLGSWDDAVDAYKRGTSSRTFETCTILVSALSSIPAAPVAALQLEPSNEGAKKALEDAVSGRAEARSSGGGRRAGGLFGPEFMGRLAMDPRTREYLTDPEFMQMMRNLQQDPMSDVSMGQYLQNEKFQQAMAVSGLLNWLSLASSEPESALQTDSQNFQGNHDACQGWHCCTTQMRKEARPLLGRPATLQQGH